MKFFKRNEEGIMVWVGYVRNGIAYETTSWEYAEDLTDRQDIKAAEDAGYGMVKEIESYSVSGKVLVNQKN